VWAFSDTDVVAAGGKAGATVLIRGGTGGFSRLNYIIGNTLNSIFGVSSTNIWIAATGGYMVHYEP